LNLNSTTAILLLLYHSYYTVISCYSVCKH
jgi:hypothetical protein